MILPVGANTFEEAMQMGSETYYHLKVTKLACFYCLFILHGDFFLLLFFLIIILL